MSENKVMLLNTWWMFTGPNVKCCRDVNMKETFNFIRRQVQTVFNGYKKTSYCKKRKVIILFTVIGNIIIRIVNVIF